MTSSCSAGQYRIGNGKWSTAGIKTRAMDNSNHVRCESSHLTSFAVLIDTATVHNVSS